MQYFDPDLLQTLIAFADSGTLAKAADIVGRTPSTVTIQMQKLEEFAGVTLFETSGRKRKLSPAGERLVIYARRILNENRQAWLNLSENPDDLKIGIGITQDFISPTLSDVLNNFAQSQRNLCLDMHIAKSDELDTLYQAQKIDILIAMRQRVSEDEIAIRREDMAWFCRTGGLANMPPDSPLPLAVLEQPCAFRKSAIKALEEARRPYRIAALSSSLAGIASAVEAGLALSPRTRCWHHQGISPITDLYNLPTLPTVEFSIRVRAPHQSEILHFAQLLARGLNFTPITPYNSVLE